MALFQDMMSLSSTRSSFHSLPRRLSPQRPHPVKKSRSICRASWQELAGVLVFSAVPFTAVKAIANSSLGESLRRRLEEKKKEALENTSRFNARAQKARADSKWYGQERPRWFGPIPYDYPSYLTGELPGDYGFDIAGLGKERLNFDIAEPVWWRVGYSKLQGETLDYLGIPGLHVAGSQGVIVIAICQALLMVGPEYARYCGIEALEPLGIYLPGDINYPGGTLFDPLNLSQDPVAFEELKVKEIKNGRLAMVAWLGFYAQAAFTGKGPVQNLVDHVSDPLHNNLLATLHI